MLCRTAKPHNTRFKLLDSKGLFLEVLPSGCKYWRLRFRIHGKEKLMTLGEYPETTLAFAREERSRISRLVKSGIDPIIQRKDEKIAARIKANTTFKEIALEWYEVNKAQWQPRYAATILHRIEKYIFPHLGYYPTSEICSIKVLNCLREIEVTAPEMARRIKQIISHIFLYAKTTKRAKEDVTADLKHALRKYKKGRFKSIKLEVLPKFLFDIYENKAKLHRQTYLALKFMMLTFVRTSEMIDAKWSEIKFEDAMWIIPAERMKMKQEHMVPLSRQAIEILNELHSITGKREHVFAGVYKPRSPMAKGTVLVAVKRLGYCGLMTGHGFRALALGVLKEKLKYTHDIADRQLAHVPKDSVDRAYDRAEYLDDRKIMMQRYADYLDLALLNERLRINPALKQSQFEALPITKLLFTDKSHVKVSVSYTNIF